MNETELLENISKRTDGAIYFGVVGAVRTGKSTFIKRMMELVVLKYITNPYEKDRTLDELPQSAQGRTIMTTEPKFVPNKPIEIHVTEELPISIRFVDSVGYTIEGAKGFEDENGPRMVHTPWFEEAITFHDAAEIGTRKVIEEHSSIGVVVTTDGTIGDIERHHYEQAETDIIEEMKALNKPFIVLVNSTRPNSELAQSIKSYLSDEYDIPVLALNVDQMTDLDVLELLKEALYEFPIVETVVHMPSWIHTLDDGHEMKRRFNLLIEEQIEEVKRLRDVEAIVDAFQADEYIEAAHISGMQTGDGIAEITLEPKGELFKQLVTDLIGEEISSKAELIKLLQNYKEAKETYDEVHDALHMVKTTGYGVTAPPIEHMTLDEPKVIKQGANYGVQLKAIASSIHMVKVDVVSEFSPIIGTEKQSEELIEFLLKDYENDPLSVWQADFFGKSLHDVVKDGIQSKVNLLPDHTRIKLKETLEKMINQGSGNMIAIIL
ncbi:MAG TPA: stage IV sporulation protein A [Pseudogracilibacillus sp.]|nr:stage IV sporulation protein A [Pseudogracilibacillus sp.]